MSRAPTVRLAVLASGSTANAILVEAGDDRVLVDAGLSVEALERALSNVGVPVHTLRAVLLTHEHEDHARGAGPLARSVGIPVFTTPAAAAAAGATLAMAVVTPVEVARPFSVGALEIVAFPVSHDAAEPVGFSITAGGKRLVIATDLGTVDDALDPYLASADLVVLESNYDLGLLHVSGYPWFVKNRIVSGRGHLSNDEAARALARTAGRRRIVCLAHLSEINNLAPLARDTVREALRWRRAPEGPVLVVPPNGRSGPITVAE